MITLAGITLPDHLVWLDEFDWLPIAHSSERSLTGKMLIADQGPPHHAGRRLGHPCCHRATLCIGQPAQPNPYLGHRWPRFHRYVPSRRTAGQRSAN